MLSVSEAVARVTGGIQPVGIESVDLLDSLGRVMVGDAVAPYTLPHWDNSAMDGYAVRGADIEGASSESPVRLHVLETVAAGVMPSRSVVKGTATRIMTGAPIPKGADSVVRVEDTDGGEVEVLIRDARDAMRNVRPRGEDFAKGSVVMEAGTAIGPAQIGILSSLGMARVEVYKKPRVAILGSGDELVELERFDQVLAGRKIVSSNSYALTAAVRLAGGEAIRLGNAADTPESLRELLQRAREVADFIVTTAGASVGAFDYTRDVLASLGATMDFWRVRMRPGAPVAFGSLGTTPWLALPGNPVSAVVTFDLFARPVIRLMMGHTSVFRRPVRVRLGETVTTGARLTHFLRAIVSETKEGELLARLTGPQGSAILTSVARANALLIVPEGVNRVAEGEQLNALLTNSDSFSSAFSL